MGLTRRYAGLALLLALPALLTGNDLLRLVEGSRPSDSEGTVAGGRLRHGKRLPTRGRNFIAHSYLGALLGRNAVHDRVRDTVLEAYRMLATTHPTVHFVYGETGWPRGGPFWPHRTHRNGLSADFMTPVVNAAGRSIPLPASLLTLWGYGIDFDREGRADYLTVDFEATAAHLVALREAGRRHGVGIATVIFAPGLAARLAGTPSGRALGGSVPFFAGRPWVRHDDHYHVDFRLD